ncbi:MAG TPA: hypothetical protein VGB54_12195 [Allosphingosinicella sp.]|jgi:hypothetical protein
MGRSALRLALAVSTALAIAGCSGGGNGTGSTPTPTPAPPPAQVANFDVLPCLTQFVSPGQTLASLVIPDVLTIDLTRPASFPNGRTPANPVIDRTLAMLFLDLSRQSIDTFWNIPVNPKGNDVPLPTAFPWLAPPFGGDRPSQGGSNFNFRTDAASAFVRVDRMGMPAVATALIGSSAKVPYNDDSPPQDVTASSAGTFKWVPEIRSQLTALTNALADDFQAAGVTMCARPQ